VRDAARSLELFLEADHAAVESTTVESEVAFAERRVLMAEVATLLR
jgi:hypothetical protein